MLKKVFCFTLLLLLLITVLVVVTASAEGTVSSTIRVKLSVGTPTSFSFFIDGNYSVEQNSSIQLDRQLYTVKLESGTLKLYYGTSLLYSGSTIQLTQHTATTGLNNFIYLYNERYNTYISYLGDFIFSISDGSIQVVNKLYLEEYLYGVVPYEMSDSWPMNALRAQAVVARSYAVKSIKSTGTYDLDDTSTCQVYRGYNASYTRAISAVDYTAKKVQTYNGAVIPPIIALPTEELRISHTTVGAEVPIGFTLIFSRIRMTSQTLTAYTKAYSSLL